MSNHGEVMVSAEVVLRPASGKSLRDMPVPTAAQLSQYLPSAAQAEAAMRVFRTAGFVVGPLGGISFSITAPRKTFESFFRTRLRASEGGGIEAAGGHGYELPLNVLPNEVARAIEAVTFTPPPDFGPSGSGP